ncbi:uncharacterized protein [Oscarella lobularis]
MANSDDAFLTAVEKRDYETVSTYIQRYPEKWKGAKNAYEETCLHLAPDAEMAKYLISAGANVEARAEWDMTPFLSAAKSGNREVMEVLIENECNIHAKGRDGEALAYASQKGHLEISKRLVALGLDVNHKSNLERYTSLHWACHWGRVEIAEYLLSVGADIEAVNSCKRTPFLEAISWGKERVMNLLIEKGCNIYATDYENKGAVKFAENYATLKETLENVFSEQEADGKKKTIPQLEAKKTTWSSNCSGSSPTFFFEDDVSQQLIDELRSRLDEAEEERNVALAEKESLAEFVQELQRRLDKSEKERNTPCTEKESLAEDLRSSQQLVQELQHRLEKERDSAQEEKRNLTGNLHSYQQFVDELQSQLIETEKERTAVCAAKKGLAEDLRASQQLVQELQGRVEEEKASARARERNLTDNLHSSQQLVRDLQLRLEEEKASARATESNLHSSQQLVRDLQKEKNTILSEHEEKMRKVQKASQYLRERSARAETDIRRMSERCTQLEQQHRMTSERCTQLEQERDEARLVAQEAQQNMSQYENVRQISSTDINISDVKLGGGSYGDVRVGRWLGCNVAVKTFYDFLRVDVYLRRLEQEISICSKVHHPNVVSLLGVITQDGIPLRIISELLEASLSDIIVAADGPLLLREQVDIAIGCSSGICYLHGLGILHGDIRSTNVVVTSVMEAKICDLGAARFSEINSLSAGPMSPPYVAPERSEPGQHNTKIADVYSLGVTFIELMTGEQPAPRKRMAQATSVRHPIIKRLGLAMVDLNLSKRPSAADCLARLEVIQKSDEEYKSCPAKRMVKGRMHGGEKVELVGEPWN